MFFKKSFDFDKFLGKYQKVKADLWATSELLKDFPSGTGLYKNKILSEIDKIIYEKDSTDLSFYLRLGAIDGLDEEYKKRLKDLILADWHEEHEDIVDYVSEFKDDYFTNDLFTIATTEFPYRKYDDENEATLRKCVHALKGINSTDALHKLRILIESGNKNVHYALENYK